MTTRNIKTVLFASLIAAMILPFSGGLGVQPVEAAKTPYTLAEINSAFSNSEGYVTYDSDGNMAVDKKTDA